MSSFSVSLFCLLLLVSRLPSVSVVPDWRLLKSAMTATGSSVLGVKYPVVQGMRNPAKMSRMWSDTELTQGRTFFALR